MNVFQGMRGAAEELTTGRVQYTVLDGRRGFFQNVRRIVEFSEDRIVLAGKRDLVTVEGTLLTLGKCFGGDVAVEGNIRKVEREEHAGR